jgi:polyprenyl-phospho-N-acetylgalactosaminyl synthase
VGDVRCAGYAVVVVNDGSQDSTADHTCAAGAAVIVHPFNLGQGGALRTGIKCAIAQAADIIVIFDANRQHQVSDIVCRADFALGSRFLGQAPDLPPLRRLLLRPDDRLAGDRRPQRAASAMTRTSNGSVTINYAAYSL